MRDCHGKTGSDPARQPRGACRCDRENRRLLGSGTAVANIENILSGTPPSRSTWGGSRNRRDRVSCELSLAQGRKLRAAAERALAIGLPLNRHVTIHWEQAGVSDERAAWATGRFLKLAGDWLRRNGHRFAWMWVRENGERKGSHVHILLHVPAGVTLGRMQTRWLRTVSGRRYSPTTIKTTRIGGTAGAAHSSPATYQSNLNAVVDYLLKGAAPAAAAALRVHRLAAGGRVLGKRAATSQNLGQGSGASRTRGGRKSLRIISDTDPTGHQER